MLPDTSGAKSGEDHVALTTDDTRGPAKSRPWGRQRQAAMADHIEHRDARALSARGTSKSFRHKGERVQALTNVSLEVAAGEFVCLVGPSGCGKSTLLNLFAGFDEPDEGGLFIDAERIRRPGVERCVLFQTPTLFSWMTVEDNVLFGPRARGVLDGGVRSEAQEILREVGLDRFSRHYPHQLSGGMRHRAAFARALINHPPVLLLDEPFAALDAITRVHMQEFLLQLWQQWQMTVLFVTHDVEEAAILADRVCVMSARPGRIIADYRNPLERPRTYEVSETAEFLEVRRHIRSLVEEGSQ